MREIAGIPAEIGGLFIIYIQDESEAAPATVGSPKLPAHRNSPRKITEMVGSEYFHHSWRIKQITFWIDKHIQCRFAGKTHRQAEPETVARRSAVLENNGRGIPILDLHLAFRPAGRNQSNNVQFGQTDRAPSGLLTETDDKLPIHTVRAEDVNIVCSSL